MTHVLTTKIWKCNGTETGSKRGHSMSDKVFITVAHFHCQKFSLQSKEIYSLIFIWKGDENFNIYSFAKRYLHNTINNTES